MASVKDRVYEFCRTKKIPISTFEKACQMSNGYISSMRIGFGEEKLNNVLAAFPELNREWLLYGEGNMLKNEEVNEDKEENGQISITESSLNRLLAEMTAQREMSDRHMADAFGIIKHFQEQTDRLITLMELKNT